MTFETRKDKFGDIYTYLYLNGHKGIVADNDIIKDHVAFQYEIDHIKSRMCQKIKDNRMYIYSLIKSGVHIDDALNQLFENGDFIAKRKRKPAGWSFIFTDDELTDMEMKYGKTNEARLEGSYNIYDVLKIDVRKFKEIKRKKKKVENDAN